MWDLLRIDDWEDFNSTIFFPNTKIQPISIISCFSGSSPAKSPTPAPPSCLAASTRRWCFRTSICCAAWRCTRLGNWWIAMDCWLVVEENPTEKYEFVNWDDDIPNILENKKCSKPPTRFYLKLWNSRDSGWPSWPFWVCLNKNPNIKWSGTQSGKGNWDCLGWYEIQLSNCNYDQPILPPSYSITGQQQKVANTGKTNKTRKWIQRSHKGKTMRLEELFGLVYV